jgi:S1-C subfamily serine protease
MDAIVSPRTAAFGALVSAAFVAYAARASIVTPHLHESGLKTVADRVHGLAIQVRARAFLADDTERGVRVHEAVSVASGVLIGDGVAIVELDAVTVDTADGLVPANQIEVVIDDVGAMPARLIAGDRSLDIAVLQLPAAVRDVPGAVLADDAPSVGDAVLAFGVDGDSVSAAQVLLARWDGDDSQGGLRIDRALPARYRGGPIFDARGELVGVTTRVTDAGSNGVATTSSLRSVLHKAFAADGI